MCYDVRGFANGVLNSYYFLIKYSLQIKSQG